MTSSELTYRKMVYHKVCILYIGRTLGFELLLSAERFQALTNSDELPSQSTLLDTLAGRASSSLEATGSVSVGSKS